MIISLIWVHSHFIFLAILSKWNILAVLISTYLEIIQILGEVLSAQDSEASSVNA